MFLANSFVANASANTRNAIFKIVHSDLLNKTWQTSCTTTYGFTITIVYSTDVTYPPHQGH